MYKSRIVKVHECTELKGLTWKCGSRSVMQKTWVSIQQGFIWGILAASSLVVWMVCSSCTIRKAPLPCAKSLNSFPDVLQAVPGVPSLSGDRFSKDSHDRDRAQADRQLQQLNRERAELERSGCWAGGCGVWLGNVKTPNLGWFQWKETAGRSFFLASGSSLEHWWVESWNAPCVFFKFI